MEPHMTHVDLLFQVVGEFVPIDHGYSLYSAICKTLQADGAAEAWLHAAVDVGLIPFRGTATGADHRLILDRGARFGFRVPAADIPRLLPLAGRALRIGPAAIRVGTATVNPLVPAVTLYARIVTTKNGDETERFDAEIERQLATLGVRGTVERGRRRIMTISQKKVVGHELVVKGLSPEDSVLLQEKGLGGRRKMGAGVFLPASGMSANHQ